MLLIAGSALAPLLIGVGLGDLLHGLPINSSQNYTGSFWDLLQPYALFTCILSIFVGLYPNVMVSATSKAYNLTVHNTASTPYSLKAMTVVVIIVLPVVLAYQAWTYYVFRRRVSKSDFQPPAPSPGTAPEPEPAPRPAAPPVRPGS